MRLAFLVLLLANLLLVAWGRNGWRAEEPGREPERLAGQIAPEKLRLLPAAAAVACRRIEWLAAAEAGSLAAAVADLPGWEATVAPRVEPPAHWVVMPELPTRAAAETKRNELRRLGVNESEIVTDATLGPFAISLGVFRGEQTAGEYLRELQKKGVRSARLASRELPPTRFAVDFRAPAGELAEKLPVLAAGLADTSLVDCPAR